jgi:hypothetical protein
VDNGGPRTDSFIEDCDWLPISIEPDRVVRGIIDHKPNRFAKRGDPFREAIEHLPHETHRSLSRVKVDPQEFLDANDRGHENRARHNPLCENDCMRTKILPPEFVTRFGFLLLCQFNFANRWSSACFTVSADVSKARGKASKHCFVPLMSPSHKPSIRRMPLATFL